MRVGALSKTELEKRIKARFPDFNTKSTTTSQLLGHAIYHDLVSEKEIEETTAIFMIDPLHAKT